MLERQEVSIQQIGVRVTLQDLKTNAKIGRVKTGDSDALSSYLLFLHATRSRAQRVAAGDTSAWALAHLSIVHRRDVQLPRADLLP
jgi:hypothetical protein